MYESLYFIEMTTKWKREEIARGIDELRVASAIGRQPSRLRETIATALVRFGVFLNGNAYRCPEAAARQ